MTLIHKAALVFAAGCALRFISGCAVWDRPDHYGHICALDIDASEQTQVAAKCAELQKVADSMGPGSELDAAIRAARPGVPR